MTIVEFIEAQCERQRGDAQYVLNLADDLPVMYGSLRSAVLDSARAVLAGVAAKRRVVELHGDDALWCGWTHGGYETHEDFSIQCDTLLALAQEWRGAEGWDEGWAL